MDWHDDLAMVYASHQAMLSLAKSSAKKTCIAAYFDSEETGSQSSGGAKSSFLRAILEKITLNYQKLFR